MTRSFALTLLDTSWHTLWSLLQTDARFNSETNPILNGVSVTVNNVTFTTAPFSPSQVAEFEIDNLSANMNISFDSYNEIGSPILSTASYKKSCDINRFDLKSIYVKGSSSATFDFNIVSN